MVPQDISLNNVADPDSGSDAFLTSGSGIRDQKIKIRDPGWTSRIMFPRA